MTGKEIIESFYQGSTGNCVTVAAIKAAIGQYGLNNVLSKEKEVEKETFEITMRDGFKTLIRYHDQVLCYKKSEFVKDGSAEVTNQAKFLYTCMVKRILVEGGIDSIWGGNKLRKAIKSLNNGEDYKEGPYWLGIPVKKITESQIANYKHIIGASAKHCFYITDGYYDNYGTPTPLDQIASKAFERTYLLALLA